MISLSILLSTFGQSFLRIWGAPDEKLQNPTYFIATYFDTKDSRRALWVDKIVRHLARYILLYDRFFETGNDRYPLLAKNVRATNKFLMDGDDHQYLGYSLDHSLKQFWTFWELEKLIRFRFHLVVTLSRITR